MGRPKGSKNGPRETIKSPAPAVAVDSQPDLVLTLRRITVGSFAGLWELCKINPDGSTKVLTDANTKMIAANLARNEVVKCGA